MDDSVARCDLPLLQHNLSSTVIGVPLGSNGIAFWNYGQNRSDCARDSNRCEWMKQPAGQSPTRPRFLQIVTGSEGKRSPASCQNCGSGGGASVTCYTLNNKASGSEYQMFSAMEMAYIVTSLKHSRSVDMNKFYEKLYSITMCSIADDD